MKRLIPIFVLLIATATAAGAATTHHAGAKISLATARSTALARVPGGRVREGELEREHGRLIYSFDIAVAGKPGIEEVQVDARTGKIVSQTHETPKHEAREKVQEKAETNTRH
jgi:uncharacterized membrane protein YkoI